jgi:anti-sigma B factor antagonist
MEIERSLEEEILVLQLAGDFDITETETFSAEITEAIEADNVRVLVDFGQVDFMNSTALGTLLRSQKRLAQYGGGMAAARPNPFVEKTFKMLQLDRRIPIFADPDEAMAHLKGVNPESVSGTGEEVIFHLPGSEDTFGPRARRGKLEVIQEEELTLTFDNFDALDPETTFAAGTRADLQFKLPLYHPTHVFKVGGEIRGFEVLGPETVSLRVGFTSISDAEQEAIVQYVKDLRFLKDEV